MSVDTRRRVLPTVAAMLALAGAAFASPPPGRQKAVELPDSLLQYPGSVLQSIYLGPSRDGKGQVVVVLVFGVAEELQRVEQFYTNTLSRYGRVRRGGVRDLGGQQWWPREADLYVAGADRHVEIFRARKENTRPPFHLSLTPVPDEETKIVWRIRKPLPEREARPGPQRSTPAAHLGNDGRRARALPDSLLQYAGSVLRSVTLTPSWAGEQQVVVVLTFGVAVAELQPAETFYQKALGRYGTVGGIWGRYLPNGDRRLAGVFYVKGTDRWVKTFRERKRHTHPPFRLGLPPRAGEDETKIIWEIEKPLPQP